MRVFLVVGKRRTLHRAIRDNGTLLTSESCNVDSAGKREEYTDYELARQASKRVCRRCLAA
jgi:hypothetical protein